MTTIATDGKTMAADGCRFHRDTCVISTAVKVRRLHDGALVGTAGDVGFGMTMVEWLESGGPPPEFKDDGSALLLETNGDCFILDRNCLRMPVQAPVAIGSGMDLAIGAMLAGASPAEAVKIAGLKDPHTGGTITVRGID